MQLRAKPVLPAVVVVVVVAVGLALGCSKRSGGGAEGSAFDQRWAAVAQQGTQPIVIHDEPGERGEALMGSVLGAQQGALAMAATVALSYKGGARLPETPDPEQVQRLVRQYMPGVKSCYQRLAREGHAPSGKALVSFQIAGNGHVQALEVEAPAFQGTPLPACITAQITHWAFPPSRKGMPGVRYPFVFVGA